MKKAVNCRLMAVYMAVAVFVATFITDVNAVKAADYSAWSAIFDATYYYNNCADAKAYAGTNVDMLWQYFVKVGIPRGDQASEEFNVFIYAKNYPDLVKVFGGNYMSYYVHYAQAGKAEGRNAKTLLNQTAVAQPVAQQIPVQAVDNTTASYQSQILELVNAERVKNGVPALTLSDSLCNAAMTRTNELTSYYSHTRPNGSRCFTVLQEMGIDYWGAGENIAAGQRTPQEVMNDWMHSSGHRANILNPSYTKLGVGYANSGKGYGSYWAQIFIY